jgi:hypothetical protein
MAILTERQGWSRKRKRARASLDLSAAEQANVKAALRALRKHLGGWAPVASALACTHKTVEHSVGAQGRPSGAMAIRVARAAGVTVEDVLTGAFPKHGACPRCGWLGERA